MAFNKISVLLLVLLPAASFCQDKNNAEVRDVTKATFLNPGLSYEKRIAKFQSLYAQAFMNFSFSASYSSSLGSNVSVYFDPALTLQYRYYYNAAKREANGRRTEMNSSNYVCLVLQTVFSRAAISSSYYVEENRRAMNTIGIAWGLQRNFPKRFSVDLNIGPGYLFAKSTSLGIGAQPVTKTAGQFTLVGQLNLGFWLNKRK